MEIRLVVFEMQTFKISIIWGKGVPAKIQTPIYLNPLLPNLLYIVDHFVEVINGSFFANLANFNRNTSQVGS